MDWTKLLDIVAMVVILFVTLKWAVADSINSTIQREIKSLKQEVLRELEYKEELLRELIALQSKAETELVELRNMMQHTKKNSSLWAVMQQLENIERSIREIP